MSSSSISSATSPALPSAIITEMYGTIQMNEVGNTQAAYSIRPPVNTGTNNGWTIGFDQEDLNENYNTAKETLIDALTSSGYFDTENAQAIALELHNAQTSSNENLAGITTTSGTLATIDNINQALSTPATQTSINASSLQSFTNTVNTLNTNIFTRP